MPEHADKQKGQPVPLETPRSENTSLADTIVQASLRELVRKGILTQDQLSQASPTQIDEYTVRCQNSIAWGTYREGIFTFRRTDSDLQYLPHGLSANLPETPSHGQPTKEEVIAATRESLAAIRKSSNYQPPHETVGLFVYGSRLNPNKRPRAPKIDETGEVIKEGSDIDTIAIASNPDGPFPYGDINADLNTTLQSIHPKFRGIAFHNRGSYNPNQFRIDLELGVAPQISWLWLSSPDAAYFVGSLPETTIYVGGKVVTVPALSEEQVNERLSFILHSEAGKKILLEQEAQRAKQFILAHIKT